MNTKEVQDDLALLLPMSEPLEVVKTKDSEVCNGHGDATMTKQEFIAKWRRKEYLQSEDDDVGYVFWCESYDESRADLQELCQDFLSIEGLEKQGMAYDRALRLSMPRPSMTDVDSRPSYCQCSGRVFSKLDDGTCRCSDCGRIYKQIS